MAVVHSADLIDTIIAGGESAQSLNQPGWRDCLARTACSAGSAVSSRRSSAGVEQAVSPSDKSPLKSPGFFIANRRLNELWFGFLSSNSRGTAALRR